VATGKIKQEHYDAIAAVVKKRESSMSTGIGFALAFRMPPRFNLRGGGAPWVAQKGINFDALDNQPVIL